MLDKTKKDWWKAAVFYQVYPKSFQDTNGDGVGDLQGVRARLDYLQNLGIDGIWMSPVLQSPQADNGYDISDYQEICPMFGTMDDMEELIAEGKRRGISIILDMVLNHTSDEHAWFLQAKSSRTNPYHDYYVWRDGEPDCPPNDMRAVFGGPAWTYVPELGQYYFHQFAPMQPDLNWDNPKVREELYRIIRFWVEKGVEGFRLDVIDQIAKVPDEKITGNGPMLYTFLREMSAKAFCEEYLVTVGEAWGANTERAKLYSAPDGSELSMVFQFEHICLDQKAGGEKWDVMPLSLPALKKVFERWQQELYGRGWNSLFLNNHDLPRIVSRWGNDGIYRKESAKMLGAMLHGMQGTPFIYQGEEIGMTNVKLDISEYDDIEIAGLYRERREKGYSHEEIMESIYARGRDNARTMMQWSAEKNAGFTEGTPWFAINPNYKEINVEEALSDEASIFYFYQNLIRFRKLHPVVQDGDFTLLCPEDEKIFAYTREIEGEKLLVICNFTEEMVEFAIPDPYVTAECVLCNYREDLEAMREAGGAGRSWNLKPYETMYLFRSDFGLAGI